MFIVCRVTVRESERVIVIRNQRFSRVLEPGVHWVWGRRVELERQVLESPVYAGEWIHAIAEARASQRYFTVVETGQGEVAAVYFDGELVRLVGPCRRVLYWRDGGREVTAEVYDGYAVRRLPLRTTA